MNHIEGMFLIASPLRGRGKCRGPFFRTYCPDAACFFRFYPRINVFLQYSQGQRTIQQHCIMKLFVDRFRP